MGAIISKTGCYIPNFAVRNDKFLDNSFLDNDGNPFFKKNQEIIEKFSTKVTYSHGKQRESFEY